MIRLTRPAKNLILNICITSGQQKKASSFELAFSRELKQAYGRGVTENVDQTVPVGTVTSAFSTVTNRPKSFNAVVVFISASSFFPELRTCPSLVYVPSGAAAQRTDRWPLGTLFISSKCILTLVPPFL